MTEEMREQLSKENIASQRVECGGEIESTTSPLEYGWCCLAQLEVRVNSIMGGAVCSVYTSHSPQTCMTKQEKSARGVQYSAYLTVLLVIKYKSRVFRMIETVRGRNKRGSLIQSVG